MENVRAKNTRIPFVAVVVASSVPVPGMCFSAVPRLTKKNQNKGGVRGGTAVVQHTSGLQEILPAVHSGAVAAASIGQAWKHHVPYRMISYFRVLVL